MDAIGNMVLTDTRYKPKHGLLMDGEYYIKVNLPDSEESYGSGNGEGVWAKVDEQTCRDYDNDKRGKFYSGELANDSIYYPGLVCGATIPFEMRGKNRPVVKFSWLDDNYGPCQW